MTEQHSFIIPIATLQEKVEKHTSVIGKHRKGEEEQHLYERYSLTKGEDFLFDDYLKDATIKTYNWVKAFARNLSDGYRVYHNMTVHKANEDEAMRVVIDGNEITIPSAVLPVRDSWYNIEREHHDMFHVTVNLPNAHVYMGDATSAECVIRAKYTTVADGIFENKEEWEKRLILTADTDIDPLDFTVRLSQREFRTKVKSVDAIEIHITDIVGHVTELYLTGELIEFTKKDGKVLYGIQQSTSTKIDVVKWFDVDISDCVIFKVELPDWQDRNMLPAAQEHIENALAYYIMYRWFDEVQEENAQFRNGRWRSMPRLADTYLVRWEEEGRSAQLALNSEKRILQRKATWLQ